MNVLKSIEKHMEKMVEGIFGRAFKSSVQPVELAHKLAKEMSDHKTVSVSRIYVPNEYEVYLSPGDYEQLSSFEGPLVEDLASYLVAYANRESWTLVATPRITLHSDDDLALGEFGIAAISGGWSGSSVRNSRSVFPRMYSVTMYASAASRFVSSR